MNETETTKDETIFTLRLPNDLKDKLDVEASREERSRHGQIIKILRDRYASLPSHQEQTAQAA